MLLKDYLEQGLSITALANRFNISRGTIHNWITSGRLDQDLELGSRGYSPRPLVPHKWAARPDTRPVGRLEDAGRSGSCR